MGDTCKPDIKHYVQQGAVSIEDILYRAGGTDGNGKMPSRTIGANGLDIKDVNLEAQVVKDFEKDIGYSREAMAKYVEEEDFSKVSPLHYSWYAFRARVSGYRDGDEDGKPDAVTETELRHLQSDASEKGLEEVAYQVRSGVSLVHRLMQGKVGSECATPHEPELRTLSEIKAQIQDGEFENVVEVMLALGGSRTGGFPNHQVDDKDLAVNLSSIEFNSAAAKAYEAAIGYVDTPETPFDEASATPLQLNWHHIRTRVKGFRELSEETPNLVTRTELEDFMEDATDAGIRQAVREMRATADLLQALTPEFEAKVIHNRVKKEHSESVKFNDETFLKYNGEWYAIIPFEREGKDALPLYQPVAGGKDLDGMKLSHDVAVAKAGEGEAGEVDGVQYKKYNGEWYALKAYKSETFGEMQLWQKEAQAPDFGFKLCDLDIFGWFCSSEAATTPDSGWSVGKVVGAIVGGIGLLALGRWFGKSSQKKKDITTEVDNATTDERLRLANEKQTVEQQQAALANDRAQYAKNLKDGIAKGLDAQKADIRKEVRKEVDKEKAKELEAALADKNELVKLKGKLGLPEDASVDDVASKFNGLQTEGKNYKAVLEILSRMSGKKVSSKDQAAQALAQLVNPNLDALEAEAKAYRDLKVVLEEATGKPINDPAEAVKAVDGIFKAGETSAAEAAAPVSGFDPTMAAGSLLTGDQGAQTVGPKGAGQAAPAPKVSATQKPTSQMSVDPLHELDLTMELPPVEDVLQFLQTEHRMDERELADYRDEWTGLRYLSQLADTVAGKSPKGRSDLRARLEAVFPSKYYELRDLAPEAIATLYVETALGEPTTEDEARVVDNLVEKLSLEIRKKADGMPKLDGDLSKEKRLERREARIIARLGKHAK